MRKDSFLENLKTIYFSPSNFFDKNRDAKLNKALVQLILFYVVYVITESFLNLVIFFKDNGKVQPIEVVSWAFLTLQNIIGRSILMLVFLFSISGLIYLFLRIAKINKEYGKNLRSASYAFMLWTIYGFIITLSSFVVQLTIPIDQSYIQGLASTSDLTNILQLYKIYFSNPGAIILLIIGISQIVHFFTFLVKSTSYFNKIKTGKAILISVSSAAIVFILLLLIWAGYIYAVNYLTDPFSARFS
ncbi:hypothetical protein COX97_02150 [Candidatus Pacearchaeota archaeon CG_4_10_14_0_2_um_filter_05_32_18]|nr:MAG: hypothetical protein COX97_02150 [Candidatus Pacearchaeota archaeon CG_4_10_14_0_2_um_filter_05_32_18]